MHEGVARAGAALDVGEALLPRSGELGRRERVVAEERDRLPALRRRPQLLPEPLDVADADQLLDRLRAGRGRPEARLLHRLAQLLVLDLLPGGLHVLEERRLGVARRRLGLLLEHLRLLARAALALVDLGEALAQLVVVARRRLLGGGLLAERRSPPAGLDQPPAAGAEAVAAGLGDDLGVLELGLGVEDGQEAAHDEVEDAGVVAGQLLARQLAGRDDRVVVVDLGVVHDPRERQHVEPGHVRRGLAHRRDARQAAGGRLERRDLVGREELRAGSRIGDDGAGRGALVQALGRGERPLRGEPVAAVRVALEARQVVEERRAGLALGALDGRDECRRAAGRGGHRLGDLPLGGAVLLALEPAPDIPARALEPEPGVDLEIGLGHERVDLDVAADDQRQRRRLHPAERDDAAQRRGPSRSRRGWRSSRPASRPRSASGPRRPAAPSPRRAGGSRIPRGSRPSSSTTPRGAGRAWTSWPRP